MAMTMTRTRTQTALTKLVQKLADIKGELAFVDAWMTEAEAPTELARRRVLLEEQAQALTTTLHLFDPEIDASQVVAAERWRIKYKARSTFSVRKRYQSQRR